MSVVCPVCQDLITEDPSGGGGSVKGPESSAAVFALRCGHLFHQHCVTQWFTTRQNANTGPCPSCQTQSSISQATKIYLALEEESETGSSGSSRKQLNKKVADLEKQLKTKTDELKRVEAENKRIIMKSAHESMELMDLFDDLKAVFNLDAVHGEMSDVVQMMKDKYNSVCRQLKQQRI